MQLIIIGASGFIGRHLFRYCRRNDIYAVGTYYNNRTSDDLIYFDMYDQTYDDLLRAIPETMNMKDSAIVLCSANARIDRCKMNEELSYKLNVQKTKDFLICLERLKIKTVFLSSEAVFDGKKGMYSEDNTPNPVTVYGRQKYEIEKFITENMESALIVRISRGVGSSFGEDDIFDEFYQKIQRGEKIICLKGQSFCLTEVEDIAKAIVLALRMDLCGTYHISSDNYITRFNLAKLFSEAVLGGKGFIEEKDYDEMNFLDNRHVKGGLDGTKFKTETGMEYMALNEIMEKYKSTLRFR